jgi:hypothetical protein
MQHKLVCGKDPEKMGIKDDQGKWDIDRLIHHIDECKQCKDYYTEMLLGPQFVSP